MQNIQVNHLVTVDNEYGIGKVVNIYEEKVEVRFFINIKKQIVKTYDISQVSIVYLSPKTRVYIYDPETKRWQMGRVKKYDQTINPVMDYFIHFPNQKDEWHGSENLEVRCLQPLEDPTEVLAYYGGESQFLHDIRSKSLQKLVEMKASSHGMTALTSSSIDFIPYQVEIVQRILSDNTQRYLLADEVGM
jgi:ATP-dependent helicase HepA